MVFRVSGRGRIGADGLVSTHIVLLRFMMTKSLLVDHQLVSALDCTDELSINNQNYQIIVPLVFMWKDKSMLLLHENSLFCMDLL